MKVIEKKIFGCQKEFLAHQNQAVASRPSTPPALAIPGSHARLRP